MQLRPLDGPLQTSIVNNDPFVYYHLVKFERPQPSLPDGAIEGIESDFTYITDAPYNVPWDDGSTDSGGNPLGEQDYIANKLISVGGIQETIEARASTMSIKLSLAAVGTIISDNVTVDNTGGWSLTGTVDFALLGFREGDKVLVEGNGTFDKHLIILRFEKSGDIPNSKFYFTDVDLGFETEPTPTTYTLTLVSEELNTLIFNKDNTLYTNYINREVYIYRAHANPSTGAMYGDPFLLFKGIISQGSIEERPDKISYVTWGLTSHWGDFVRVQGRITSDASHRALDLTGQTDRDALLKPEYETDFGFIHAERSINVLATYQAQEIRYRSRRSSGLSGWLGGRKVEEYYVTVDRDVDVRFNLNARYLPVVYGVQRIDSIPIFADIGQWDVTSDTLDTIFVAYAICEGEIAGIYDIYIEEEPSVCSGKEDADVRSPQTPGANLENVDVVCYGRADRGDVLAGEDYVDRTSYYGLPYIDFAGEWRDIAFDRDGHSYRGLRPTRVTLPNPVTGDPTGITHEEGYEFYKPVDATLVAHTGKTDQEADQGFVQQAATRGFKIQNDYYEGDASNYWGPSHRLLDTAYVTGRFTISEGEETIPTIEFIVKGKYIECYNYDGSYKHNPNFAVPGTEDPDNFALGQSVDIQVSTNGTDWSTPYPNAQIIDKWRIWDRDGNADHRFRWNDSSGNFINITDYTKIRMKTGASTYWTMLSAEDYVFEDENITAILPVATTAKSYTNGPPAILTLTLDSGDPNYGTLNTILTNSADNSALIAFTSAPKHALEVRSYSGSVLTLAPYSAAASIVNDNYSGGKIVLINAVKVAATDFNDLNEKGHIEVTRIINNIPQTIKKKISSLNTTDKVIYTEGAFSENFVAGLDTSDWTSVSAITPVDECSAGMGEDERVSINPSMQTLDYITNRRYGKGLNIDTELNKESFLESGRLCDDRSKIKIATIAGATIGHIFRLYATDTGEAPGDIIFQGEVSGSTQIDTALYEIEFDNIIGKLGQKWTDWREFRKGQIVWGKDKAYLNTGTDYTVITETTFDSTGADSTFTLSNESGGSNLTVKLDRLGGTPYTNSVVRAHSSGNDFALPGYSLHDSDDVKFWKYVGWDEPEQRYVTRHQLNQVINTSTPIFDNINSMLSQFNGLLRYTNGLYELDIKTGAPSATDSYWVTGVTEISEDDIIGKIKIDDKGQKNSYNSITANIVDPQNKFNARAVSFFNSVEESRAGLNISFTIDQKGYLLLAGNIISLSYNRFNWVDKLFRIETLTTKSNGEISIVAKEHNDDAFLIDYSDRSPGDGKDEGPDGTAPTLLTAPSNLQASQDRDDEIVLTWINSAGYDRTKHYIEIWAVEADEETSGVYTTDSLGDYEGNDFSNATFLDQTQGDHWVHDGFEVQPFHVWFYWIRYVKFATAPGELAKYSPYEPDKDSSFPDGVEGRAGSTATEGYTFLWTNQSVQVFRDSTGNIADLSPTAFEFAVYKGANKLVPVVSTPGVGQFSITLTGVVGGVDSTPPGDADEIIPDQDHFDPAPVDNVIQVDEVESIGGNVTFGQIRIDINIEGTVWTPSLYQNIQVSILGSDAWLLTGNNTEHIFICDETGYVDDAFRDFKNNFILFLGLTEYTYDDSTYPADETFHYGTITSSANINENVNYVTGEIQIFDSSTFYLGDDPDTIDEVGTIAVEIVDKDDITIKNFTIHLSKRFSGIRGGSEFFIDATTATYVTAADVALWAVDPFSSPSGDTAAENIGKEIIGDPKGSGLSPDGFLRPNDRITVANAPTNVAGTRIWDVPSEWDYTNVSPSNFSSLVVEIFDGSVIVNGTLSADALVANIGIINNMRILSNLVIGDTGGSSQLYSYEKTSFSDPDAGFYMNDEGKFIVGDADSYLKFDPTGSGVVEIRGNLLAGGNYQISTWDTGTSCELSTTNQRMRNHAGTGAYSDTEAWVRSNTSYSSGSTALCVPSATTVEYRWGLSDNSSASHSGLGINYGFDMNKGDTNGRLAIWVNGAADSSIDDTYTTGDVLAVIYHENNIYFYKNSTLLHTIESITPATYFWEANIKDVTASTWITYEISFSLGANPEGAPGVAGAGMYAITEDIPNAVALADFREYITIEGYDTSGSGGIFEATGRDYAVKGDICVVKDFPHPDGSQTGPRVSAFICNKQKWVTADGIGIFPNEHWTTPAAFIDGELVVNGTIHGSALRIYGADTGDGILIGENDTQRIDVYSDSNLRVRLGDLVTT
jgi:hypothetical protein